MRELDRILDHLARADRPAVLVTLVGVQGSAYRRPGARLLVTAAGERIGGISGGCLEAEVTRRAWWRTERGPDLWTIANDPGSGCGGTLTLLLERILPDALPLDLQLANCCRECAGTGIAATRLDGVQRGQRWIRREKTWSGNTPLPADDAAELTARTRHLTRASRFGHWYVEPFGPPSRLWLFGAGPDAEPLAKLALAAGFDVTVVDRRSVDTLARRFPGCQWVGGADPEQFGGPLPRAADAAVTMTHRVGDDAAWLRLLLASPARYIGVLGARHRTAQLLDGVTSDRRLHAPAGLDLGGDAPEDVALAILAEVRAVLSNRTGGMLRDRTDAIHDRTADAEPAIATERELAACGWSP